MEFLRADAGGAQFAHDDASGGIGEHCGFGERRPRRGRQGQNAENGVPRPGDVEDLPAGCATLDTRLAHARVGHFKTRRRNMQMAGPGFLKYAHSLFAARDHHRATAEMREQRAARFFNRFLVGERARDVETCLFGIANDGPRAAIRV